MNKEQPEYPSKAQRRRKYAERRTDDLIDWLKQDGPRCVMHDEEGLDTTKDFWVVQNGLDIYRATTQEKVLVMAGKGKAVLVKR